MTHVFFFIALYLFIGSLVMLLTNELIDGAVTRLEFVEGMAVWPAIIAVFCWQVILAYVRRAREALRRG
jgi:hypothetical protein